MGTPGPTPTHTLTDTLGIFLRLDDPGTPLTAAEVADELGCTRRTAFSKLQALVEREELRSKKTGARGRVWWRPVDKYDTHTETELLDSVLETVPVGVAVIDPSGTLLRANSRALALLGPTEGDLEEYTVGTQDVYDAQGQRLSPAERPSGRAFRTGEEVIGEHIQVRTEDGESIWLSVNAHPLTNADGEVNRVVLAGEDITQLKEQTERLKRQRDELEAEIQEVFDRVTDAFYTLDEEWRFTHVNEQAEAIIQRAEEDVIGKRIWDEFPEATESIVWDKYHEAMETQRPVSFELFYEPLDVWAEVSTYPSDTGLSVYFRDISDRKERERELAVSEARYRTLAETATDAIITVDTDNQIRFANPSVEDVFGYSPEDLLGQSALTLLPAADRASYRDAFDRFFAQTAGQIDETNLEIPGIRKDGEEIDLHVSFSDFMIEGERRITAIIRDITTRKERERALTAQRERLTTLNHLNDIVQDITHAVVESTTRDEIKRRLCARFAASDVYQFALIGSITQSADQFQPQAMAGLDIGTGDRIATTELLSTDRNLLRRANRTGTIQVTSCADDQSSHTSDQDSIRRFNIASLAAIPLEYDGSRYGLLVIGSKRDAAFDADERAIISQLSEVVGHAITAIDRKRALMSDTVVELHLRIMEPFDALGDITSSRITFDRAISVSDETFLMYGFVPGAATEVLSTLVAQLPHFERFRLLEETADGSRFELTLSEPPIISKIAAAGGRVASAVFEDSAYDLTVHLPHDMTVRELVETVQTMYPDTEIVAQRQMIRTNQDSQHINALALEDLTDRQRTALEAAFYAGFFDCPRDSTGEEIAGTLDIAPSTFHQHVRKGERTVLAQFFD